MSISFFQERSRERGLSMYCEARRPFTRTHLEAVFFRTFGLNSRVSVSAEANTICVRMLAKLSANLI